MDELVTNTKIVDAELVKAVTHLLPGESIDTILDEVRAITLKRVINVCKSKQFLTVIHAVEHLKTAGLTPSDITKVLNQLINEPEIQDHLKTDIKNLLDSGLFNSIFKFVCEIEPLAEGSSQKASCCCFLSRD